MPNLNTVISTSWQIQGITIRTIRINNPEIKDIGRFEIHHMEGGLQLSFYGTAEMVLNR